MNMIDGNHKDWVLSLAKETPSWYTRPDYLSDDESMHISEGLKNVRIRTVSSKD